MFNCKEDLEKLMDELKKDLEYIGGEKGDSEGLRSLRYPLKSAETNDLSRSTFRRISSLHHKTVVHTEAEIQELATLVDRKKLKQIRTPVVRIRPPMQNPYSNDT